MKEGIKFMIVEIILSFLIVISGVSGYLIGFYFSKSPTTQNFEVKQENIQSSKNQTFVYTIQAQFVIVDTYTNVNITVNEISNLIKTIIQTNYSITNYTNIIEEEGWKRK